VVRTGVEVRVHAIHHLRGGSQGIEGVDQAVAPARLEVRLGEPEPPQVLT
jgi:hypothetical protein